MPGRRVLAVAARPRAVTGRRRGGRHAVTSASLAGAGQLGYQLFLELA